MHKRICIFCGNEPSAGNKEHVIPKWLLSLTGNPKRIAHFGIDPQSGDKRSFAFQKLVFPACAACNSEYSDLEDQTKSIILKFLGEQAINGHELSTLLTWCDKVRVGLWLGFRYLHKNAWNINPHFYINKRIDYADRLLFIYRSSNKKPRLTFAGCSLPLFSHMPSCFGLSINQFYLINISVPYLLSRRLGLPFLTEAKYTKGGFISGELVAGTEKLKYPLLRTEIVSGFSEVYQPIAPQRPLQKDVLGLYDTPYARKYFNIRRNSIGAILIGDGQKLSHDRGAVTRKWIPKKLFERSELDTIFQSIVLQMSIYLVEQSLKCVDMDSSIKNEYRGIVEINKELLVRVDCLLRHR